MKEIRIFGYRMKDREKTHAYLKKKLSLPYYYGDNLDALWDCLSTDFSPKKIIIYKSNKIIEYLGDYGKSLINLFQDISEKNKFIKVEVIKDKSEKN